MEFRRTFIDISGFFFLFWETFKRIQNIILLLIIVTVHAIIK